MGSVLQGNLGYVPAADQRAGEQGQARQVELSPGCASLPGLCTPSRITCLVPPECRPDFWGDLSLFGLILGLSFLPESAGKRAGNSITQGLQLKPRTPSDAETDLCCAERLIHILYSLFFPPHGLSLQKRIEKAMAGAPHFQATLGKELS